LRQDLESYFPGRALNHDPPDLCLLSSWDYRRELPAQDMVFKPLLPNRWFLALHRSPGPQASRPGTQTCVGGMSVPAAPRKESAFVLLFTRTCTCHPKPSTNTEPFTFQTSPGIWLGDWWWWRGGPTGAHRAAFLAFPTLTAPGTAATQPGRPEIAADSSVGEQSQVQGWNRLGLCLPRPPVQKGGEGGQGMAAGM
jgi:hypothetical protein